MGAGKERRREVKEKPPVIAVLFGYRNLGKKVASTVLKE